MSSQLHKEWLKTTTESVTYLGEALMIASLLERGLGALLYMPVALPILKKKLIDAGKAESAKLLSTVTRMSEGDSKFAKTEIDNGCQATSKHTSISLWAAIENMVEDILTAYLMVDRNNVDSICAKYDIKLRSALTEEKHYRNFISQRWESATKHNSVGARYITQLSDVGINILLDQKSESVLQELSSGRDVLMHNAGLIDQRFVDKCHWLGLRVGDKFVPKRDDVKRYFEHCSSITKSIHAIVIQKCKDDLTPQ